MSKEVVAEVIALIELGLIAPEDIVKCLRKANSEPQKALAEQPAQQEPVAWPCLIAEADFSEDTVTLAMQCTDYKVSAGKHWLYTSPPAQRKPLTDDEIWKFWWSRPEVPEGQDDSMEAEFVAAVRRVLAAHGIKENT